MSTGEISACANCFGERRTMCNISRTLYASNVGALAVDADLQEAGTDAFADNTIARLRSIGCVAQDVIEYGQTGY